MTRRKPIDTCLIAWNCPSAKSQIFTFPSTCLEQFHSAIWDSVFWATVFILPQIKVGSPLSCCASFSLFFISFFFLVDRFQTPSVESPSCHLYFWPIEYESKFAMIPISGLIKLLEQFSELRDIVYLANHCCCFVYYKRILREGQIEKSHKVCIEKGYRVSMPSPGPLFRGFLMEASLHRPSWWNHWPLLIDFNL